MDPVTRQLIISTEMDQSLNRIAREGSTTESEIVGKALELYIIAIEKKRQGFKLGFTKQADRLETEVIGI
jgi:hypothetical protein